MLYTELEFTWAEAMSEKWTEYKTHLQSLAGTDAPADDGPTKATVVVKATGKAGGAGEATHRRCGAQAAGAEESGES